MESKWVNKNLFNKYKDEREKQKTTNAPVMMRSEMVWANPQAGTADKSNIYEGRFLQDPKGNFVKRYFYHMWKSGDKWYSVLCPKTHDFSAWCPFCAVVSALYNGTAEDKKLARSMKRKERYVANFFIVKDPRDETAKEDKDKNVGKVKLYEFPAKVEEKIKKELDDASEGYQEAIFDPGPGGHNFILEIKSTKPDGDGKTYPDYSSSMFARKSSSLGKNEEIEKIMASCHDIDTHVKGMEKDDDKIKSILLSENLFNFIERDWRRFKESDQTTTVERGQKEGVEIIKSEDVSDTIADESVNSESDEDVLKQLNELKF